MRTAAERLAAIDAELAAPPGAPARPEMAGSLLHWQERTRASLQAERERIAAHPRLWERVEQEHGEWAARCCDLDAVMGALTEGRGRGGPQIADEQIEALLLEAAQAGDEERVALCRWAIDGSAPARRLLARAVA